MYSIYTLSDPLSNQVKYIGKTRQQLYKRLIAHIADSKTNSRCSTYKKNWIKSLCKKGYKPIIEEIDSAFSVVQSDFLEQYWIAQFKAWGFKLTNLTVGGEHSISPLSLIKSRKPVLKYNINGDIIEEFQSAFHGSLSVNIKSLNGSGVCYAIKNDTVHLGFRWRYKTIPIIEKLPEKKFRRIIAPIDQYSLKGEYIKTWKNVNEIVKILGFNCGNVIRSCKEGIICQDYQWRYSYKKEEVKEIRKSQNFIKKPIIVEDNLNIIEFNSSREAAEYLKISYKLLYAILSGKIKNSMKLNGKKVKYKK